MPANSDLRCGESGARFRRSTAGARVTRELRRQVAADYLRRNKGFMVLFLGLQLFFVVPYVWLVEESLVLGIPLLLAFAGWVLCGATYFFDRPVRLVHATLPLSRKERGRTYWLLRVALLPLLSLGAIVVAVPILLFGGAGGNRLLLTAFPLVALSGAMALGGVGFGSKTRAVLKQCLPFLFGLALGVALYVPSPLLVVLTVEAAAFAAIAVSWPLAPRLAVDPRAAEADEPAARGKPRPYPLWLARVELAGKRLLILAFYLYFIVRPHVVLHDESTVSLGFQYFRHIFLVGIAAFSPFGFSSKYLWERFKLARALPTTVFRLTAAVYGYGFAASAFSAGVTVILIHYWAADPFSPALYATAWLLGTMLGVILPPAIFSDYQKGFFYKFIGYLLLGFAAAWMAIAPESLEIPIFFFACAAAVAFAWGFMALRCLLKICDGAIMPVVLNETRHGQV